MAVLSHIIEESADEDKVAETLVTRGRSLSSPEKFNYTEEVRTANLTSSDAQPPKESGGKKKKRPYGKRKKGGQKNLDLIGKQVNHPNAVIDKPLILEGAHPAQPQTAQILSPQKEDAVVRTECTVVQMADGSRVTFPRTLATIGQCREASPANYEADSLASQRVMDQTPRDYPVGEGLYSLYGVQGAEERTRITYPDLGGNQYAAEGYQTHTPPPAMGSSAYGTASDPGQLGYLGLLEHKDQHMLTPDDENRASQTTAMEAAARETTNKPLAFDMLSSTTEAGSPTARHAEVSDVAPPVGSTTSAVIEPAVSSGAEEAFSAIANGGLDSITFQDLLRHHHHHRHDQQQHCANAAKVTYIIISNGNKNTVNEQQPATTSQTAVVDVANMPSVSHYLLGIFMSGQFADSQIILNSASEMFWSITFNTHRLVITQSDVIGSILEQQAALGRSKSASSIYLMAGPKFSLARGFEFAVQNLYGMPLIDPASVYHFTRKALGWDQPGCEQASSNKVAEVVMDVVLCYGASGAFLNDVHIVNAAFELALHVLEWANLETALHFGIYPEDFLLQYDEMANKVDSAGTPSSSSSHTEGNKSKKGPRGKNKKVPQKKPISATATTSEADSRSHPHPVRDNLNTFVVQKWAPKIAAAAIQFLVANMPANFIFDRMAVSKELHDRIPHELRASISFSRSVNPGLANLTFGTLPQPSAKSSRASGILLALPFWHFQEWFEGMRLRRRSGGVDQEQQGNVGVLLTGELVKSLLQEREDRRLRALHDYAKKNRTSKNRAQSNSTNKKDMSTSNSGDGDSIDDKINGLVAVGKKTELPAWLVKELGYQEFAIQVLTREMNGGGSGSSGGQDATSRGGYEYFLHREWKGLDGNGGKIIRKFQ